METKDRGKEAVIIDKLLSESSSFSFVQALRLFIHYISRQSEIDDMDKNDILEKCLRMRPELTLRFPGTDITNIEKLDEQDLKYRLTVTFLGLYGASSPLPTFYTEDLLDELSDEKSIKRDFLDIINYRLYPLFFRIWSKYRLFYKVCEEHDSKSIDILYSMQGLEDPGLRKKIFNIEKYFRYTGLMLQFPRSAEGLESMIEDCFNLAGQVSIAQCVKRKVIIRDDQHSIVGSSCCTLGEDAVIGEEISDISGKFQIFIRDADAVTLHSFLPDRELFIELGQLVEFYVDQPLEWELVVELRNEINEITGTANIETVQLGNRNRMWANLGWNTWVFSENASVNEVKSCLK